MGRIFEKRKETIFKTAAQKSKLYSKYGRQLYMAAKNGVPDPEANSALRSVIERAKRDNVASHVIEKAIQKAAGTGGDQNERMWVDVVCLRRAGVKLSSDELHKAVPLRARLTMNTIITPAPVDGDPPRRADVAQLWPAEHGRPVGMLECARVSRVGGAGLLVVGVEPADGTPGHAQAWWCRMLLSADDDSPRETIPGADTRDGWASSLPTSLTDVVKGGTVRPTAF